MAQKGESDTEDRARSQADRRLIITCAVLGATGVGAGAMGAHAVKSLGPEALAWWETAARYHLLHALAVGLTAILPLKTSRAAAALFSVGVLLFSGSLYALALTGGRSLGMVTPFGGLCLMAGWVVLGLGARR